MVLAAGCDHGDVRRCPIHGRIQGAEGRSGLIAFIPTGSVRARPSANTAMVDGRFVFDRQTGPFAGEYRVLVQLSAGQFAGTDEGSTGEGGSPGRGRPGKGDTADPDAATRSAAGRNLDEYVIEGVMVPEQGPWQLDISLR